MDPIALITVGGAAGVSIWVLNLVVSGKLHSDPDLVKIIEAKDKEIADLLKVNRALTGAVQATNEHLGNVVALLQQVLKRLGGPTDVDPH